MWRRAQEKRGSTDEQPLPERPGGVRRVVGYDVAGPPPVITGTRGYEVRPGQGSVNQHVMGGACKMGGGANTEGKTDLVRGGQSAEGGGTWRRGTKEGRGTSRKTRDRAGSEILKQNQVAAKGLPADDGKKNTGVEGHAGFERSGPKVIERMLTRYTTSIPEGSRS